MIPLLVAGAAMSAYGDIMGGDADKASADALAAQLRQNAGQTQAAGQQAGEEELRKSELILSRMIAVAASSGASAVDPSVLKLASGVAAEGELAASTQRYNADSSARGMRMQADAAVVTGEAKQRASRWRAGGSILSGGYKAFGK